MAWEVKKLSEVCEKGSSNISINKIDNDNGKYPIYGAKGLIKKVSFFHQDKEYISIIKDGAGIGRIEFREPFSSVIGTLQYINPKPTINIKYLYYFLLGIDFSKYSQGAAIPHIYFKDYSKEELVLPPLPEQKRIVAILDKAFEKITQAKENAEKNLNNATEIIESYLQSVFENKGEGWEEKMLGEVCEELFAGGDVPKDNSSKFKTDNFVIPIFSNGEKNKGLYGYTNVARVTKPSITISARGTIGYSEIREEAFYPAIRLIVVTPKTNVLDLSYLKYVISGIDFTHSGSSIPQLTVPMIKEYQISFPPLKAQRNIVQKLDTLSSETKKLEAVYQQKLTYLEELKKSILQKAFNGELIEVSA